MSRNTVVRFIFTMSENTEAFKVAQYIKEKSKGLGLTQLNMLLEPAIAYYLPLALQEEDASHEEIDDAVKDCCHNLENKANYLKRRFRRQKLISNSAPNNSTTVEFDIPEPQRVTQSTFDEESLF